MRLDLPYEFAADGELVASGRPAHKGPHIARTSILPIQSRSQQCPFSPRSSSLRATRMRRHTLGIIWARNVELSRCCSGSRWLNLLGVSVLSSRNTDSGGLNPFRLSEGQRPIDLKDIERVVTPLLERWPERQRPLVAISHTDQADQVASLTPS